MNELLKVRADKALHDVELILQDIKLYGCQNEQWVLNFLDDLNKLSVEF